jgi:pSer/pThr/pTyr-binding forkhead associated (FHA) protein
MDKKNILSEIKKMITFSYEEKEDEVKDFIDAKTTTGVIVRVEGEAFVEGAQLLIVSEDGVFPAGAELVGEHELEDGSKIVLDETGVIVEVIAANGEEIEAGEVEEEVENLEVVADLQPEVDETAGMTQSVLEERIEELEKKIEEMESEIKEMIGINEEMAKFSSHVLTKIDTFVKDTPAQLEFQSIKTAYKGEIADRKEKAIGGLEAIKNIRKK